MKKIAITGGIGSGKSTVSKWISEAGYPVFSCDAIYAETVNEPAYIETLSKVFPTAVVDGKIDKKRLASIVFSDKEARDRLHAIAHPLVMQRLDEQMSDCQANSVFAEVPLLYEGGFEKRFDEIIVVIRERSARLQTVCERDTLDIREATARMSAQYDYDKDERGVLKKSNVRILVNDNDLSALKKKVLKILEDI
ncbi:MAG: dephospho-CoA kinase [Clostridia bacterium]|nr:dephospho-CoA kinase [Clostridia bacterium]